MPDLAFIGRKKERSSGGDKVGWQKFREMVSICIKAPNNSCISSSSAYQAMMSRLFTHYSWKEVKKFLENFFFNGKQISGEIFPDTSFTQSIHGQ